VQYAQAGSFFQTINQVFKFFLEAAMMIGIVVIVSLILIQDKGTQVLMPILALFAAAAIRLIPSINRILVSASAIRHYQSSLDVVYQDIKDSRTFVSEESNQSVSSTGSISFQRSIQLNQVEFSYPNTQRMVLKSVSLEIFKGESVAIVGHSGAGKTTLVDLILGLLTPLKGQVLVDGVDIWSDIKSWRSKIGYIPQTVYVLDSSLAKNIAYGVSPEEINLEKIWQVLKAVHLDDFVRELPQGLETMVGERGARLSGGQRQRLGIARVLYHDPEILVFDEATSAVDQETETAIISAINELKDKTHLIISHHSNTIRHCHRIFRLRDGHVFLEPKHNN